MKKEKKYIIKLTEKEIIIIIVDISIEIIADNILDKYMLFFSTGKVCVK